MRRALICCALAMSLVQSLLGLSLLGTSPATAAGAQVTLEPPQLTTEGSAVLKGTVTGSTWVKIEEWDRFRWRTAETITAVTGGAYEATVPATEAGVWYRATAGRSSTDKVFVQAVPEPEPEQEQEQDPAPDPAPEPDPVASDACGPRPQKADGTHWSCTLADDFAGTELDRAVWKPQTGFKAGSPSGMPCYIDDPSVISVHDGALHLSVRDVPAPIPCPGLNVPPTAHVAGMVSTYRLFSQQYGRFEARFKNTATDVTGLHEAFWLWPDDRYNTAVWPAAGEIDIAETYSKHPDLAIPFLHYTAYDNWGPIPGVNTAWNCLANRGEYNTYTLEWTTTRLEILVNGKTCLVNTSGDPAFQKPYIVALTQALGASGNEYDGRAPLPATMTVDYVRVWE